MRKRLFLITFFLAVSFCANADTKEKRERKYIFHPASIFEIPQYDPYKMHVKISSNTNECRGLTVVLKTGQTTSYVNYDDGYYQKGAARSYTRDNAKEIVIDNTTKLQWQDNSDAKTVRKTWSEAKEYCENLTLGGYDDWRLPSASELLTLLDYGRYDPAIDPTFQNVVSDYYWSSTSSVSDSAYAWNIYFYRGSASSENSKNDSYYVRCVRGERLEMGNFSRDDTKEIVTDNCTKLQWQDNSDAKTVAKTWSEAISYCENLTLGGYDDWRLPNINELLTLLDYRKYNPAIDPVFQNVGSDYYWSSTSHGSTSSSGWVVYFYNDNHHFDNSAFVRCVRAGQ